MYRVAYLLIPGMKLFRFPTRFLIVVELGLALLGAVGLTRLRADLQRRAAAARMPRALALALCAGTALDLFIHQPRQNPMVPARDWLAAASAVDVIRATRPSRGRSRRAIASCIGRTFLTARGWADVGPYFELRDLLEPNTGGGFWNTPSADCYAGIAPRWYVDVWGDHSREASLVRCLRLPGLRREGTLRIHPALPKVLAHVWRDSRAQPVSAAGEGARFVAGAGCLRLPRRGRGAGAVRALRPEG